MHGLNGHRDKTWTADNGIHWLRDLLPDDIPRARIFCWGYDANTHSGSQVSYMYIYDHALELISELCRKRKLSNVGDIRNHQHSDGYADEKQSMERPIIFVAHSLGGIVVKNVGIGSKS